MEKSSGYSFGSSPSSISNKYSQNFVKIRFDFFLNRVMFVSNVAKLTWLHRYNRITQNRPTKPKPKTTIWGTLIQFKHITHNIGNDKVYKRNQTFFNIPPPIHHTPVHSHTITTTTTTSTHHFTRPWICYNRNVMIDFHFYFCFVISICFWALYLLFSFIFNVDVVRPYRWLNFCAKPWVIVFSSGRKNHN